MSPDQHLLKTGLVDGINASTPFVVEFATLPGVPALHDPNILYYPRQFAHQTPEIQNQAF